MDFQIHRFTLSKFLDDKLFFEDDERILVLEGVVLNKKELCKSFPGLSWSETVWEIYVSKGDTFFKEFRGSFTGLLFDKRKKKWVLFTDHLGTRHMYFYHHENIVVASTSIIEIYAYLTEKSVKPKLNMNAAYMLLSYGYMLYDNTLCSEIKKLEAGHYIVIGKDTFKIEQFYTLPKSYLSDNYDEEEIIERLDVAFRNAIQRQFEKDKEYGYRHLVSLSGGLDSRMTSWVAHEMGFLSQINFTFSQSNYLDETIAKEIAADLKHEWIFKALDNGTFLKDIEEICFITGGNILYYGLAHANSFYKLINFEKLGIIHTGQLGDVVIGTFIKSLNKKQIHDTGGAYSDRFKSLVSLRPEQPADFADLELLLFYRRGINGANNGLLAPQNYSETMSPFYDIEFLEYCLSIPINVRIDHKLYKKWIIKKYPKAAAYIWESSKRKITSKSLHLRVGERKIPVEQVHSSVLRRLGLKKKPVETKFSMNPLDYWYSTNSDIKTFQEHYFYENIDRLNNHLNLKQACSELYKTGTATEKNQVLTLLSALKLLSIQ